jgi:nucleotide-binding universal stress UspA family protein
VPEKGGEGNGMKSSEHLLSAIGTILVADLVMSLDNVIAVAASAESGPPESRTLLLIIGLALSIPLIIFGSQLLMRVMERYPIIITVGAALLGFVAGEMLVQDQAVESFFIGLGGATTTIVELAGAVGVVLIGRWLALRSLAEEEAAAPAPPAVGPVHVRRVLVAVDPSATAAHAVRYLIGLRDEWRGGVPEVLLVNVQRALPGETSIAVPALAAENYHHERSELALAPARALLEAAGISCKEHTLVGDPGARIAQLARDQSCDMIVMGTRGLGSHTGALVGSVAQATLEHATVPVLFVK